MFSSDVVLEIFVIKAEYAGYCDPILLRVDSEVARLIDVKAQSASKARLVTKRHADVLFAIAVRTTQARSSAEKGGTMKSDAPLSSVLR